MKFSKEVYKICSILEELNLTDIVACNTEKLPNPVDFYIIATATSSVQGKNALQKLIEEIEKENLFEVLNQDKFNTTEWFIADLDKGFVHIFLKDTREKYNLEKLINEGNNIKKFDKLKKELEKEKARLEKLEKKSKN